MRLRIGVSACIMHADPTRPLFKGKTLLYAEESMLEWVMAAGALPVLLPRAAGPIGVVELVESVDGVVLAGGADMSPGSYGEAPLRPEWSGDAVRDGYEMDLVRACMASDCPVLGICRGAQVLNVALGGSLYQDVATQHPEHRVHRDWAIYDEHVHEIAFEPGAWIGRWYAGRAGPARVNSVHHQGLCALGAGLVVEARSVPDGVVEAVRYEPVTPGAPFAYGVQWHPEFMQRRSDPNLLDPRTLLEAFLTETDERRGRR
jgi:putative glutamine amidotransferase